MTNNHTPGPWENTGRISSSDSRLLITSDEGDIAVVGRADPDEEEANARLIAAAPDLLEALQELVDFEKLHTHDQIKAIRAARSAIAKATGEPQ